MHWSIEAATSEKARGIYKARLYTARIHVKGKIVVPERFGLGETVGRIQWGTPRFVLGVSDPRGIRSVAPLSIGEEKVEFLPGAGDAALAAGIHAALESVRPDKPGTLDYAFSLELAGTEALALAPLARDNTVTMRADWPHPSFQGVFLPARHELSADGFTAHWQVSRYAAQGGERLAACERAKVCAALTAQELGVSFVEPAGLYLRLERASKYGFLFIGLTFAAFMLFELFRRMPIHPVQYTLVGLALAMFFLLLTALSEHIAFAIAYASRDAGVRRPHRRLRRVRAAQRNHRPRVRRCARRAVRRPLHAAARRGLRAARRLDPAVRPARRADDGDAPRGLVPAYAARARAGFGAGDMKREGIPPGALLLWQCSSPSDRRFQ